MAVLVMVELLASVLDLLWGPWATMHWEELFNARAGVQFACGHWDAADELQYRTFCGGCTAEGFLAAPFFRMFGPTVLLWKIVILGFHGAVLGAGAWLLVQLVSWRAGIAFVLLMAAAPGWYRELVHTGWGNHAESTAFPLLAAALLTAASFRDRWPRTGLLWLAGAVTGFGLWFGQTSAWALPMLLLGAMVVGRAWSIVFGLGGAMGMVPWLLYYQDKPGATDATLDWWSGRQLSPPGALFDWLGGQWLLENIWEPTEYGDVSSVSMVYWWGLWVLAILGGLRIFLPVFWGRPRVPLFPAAFAPVSLLVLIFVYVIRYDLWWNLPDPYVNAAFNLRYRTPLVPLLMLCASTAMGWPWRRQVTRVLVPLGGVGLVVMGISLRLGQWTEWRAASVNLGVYLHGGWPDKTVPLGNPPQPLRRMQGRPSDVSAAATWVNGHSDVLVDCRYDHIYELGRRVGIGAQDPDRSDIVPLAESGYAAVDSEGLEGRFFADALARGLMRDSGEQVPHIVTRLDELSRIPGLDDAVGRGAGRRAARAFAPERDDEHQQRLDQRVWAGVCEGRGEYHVKAITHDGRTAPDPSVPRDLLAADAGTCRNNLDFLRGVVFVWPRYVGCGPSSWASLEAEIGPDAVERLSTPAVQKEWTLGCQLVRP